MNINERFINTVKLGTNPQLYKEYRDAGANINYCKDLALRISVKRKRFVSTLALLSVGANANACSGEPLRQAVINNDLNIAIVLLENGARVDELKGNSKEMNAVLSIYRQRQLN